MTQDTHPSQVSCCCGHCNGEGGWGLSTPDHFKHSYIPSGLARWHSPLTSSPPSRFKFGSVPTGPFRPTHLVLSPPTHLLLSPPTHLLLLQCAMQPLLAPTPCTYLPLSPPAPRCSLPCPTPCPAALLLPGNINQLVLKLSTYCEQLAKHGGVISEFVNPKYADATKTTFKSSTRLECMMQVGTWCAPFTPGKEKQARRFRGPGTLVKIAGLGCPLGRQLQGKKRRESGKLWWSWTLSEMVALHYPSSPPLPIPPFLPPGLPQDAARGCPSGVHRHQPGEALGPA